MKYVLDSSVAFKWVVPESDTPRAVQLRDEFRAGVHELIAPDVFPPELAHALTRAERQGRINDAVTRLIDVLTTSPILIPSLPLLLRAADISSTLRVGVYDCLYVALAEREGCELVTADTRLLANLKPTFPFIIDLASLPRSLPLGCHLGQRLRGGSEDVFQRFVSHGCMVGSSTARPSAVAAVLRSRLAETSVTGPSPASRWSRWISRMTASCTAS